MMVIVMDVVDTIRRLFVIAPCQNLTMGCLELVPSNSVEANNVVLASMSGMAIRGSNPLHSIWIRRRFA
jgi:hypothetical protein